VAYSRRRCRDFRNGPLGGLFGRVALLDPLADEAPREPSLELWMDTEATSVQRESGQVTGARHRTSDGRTDGLGAVLTLGCDGRGTPDRARPEPGLYSSACLMDARWFRLPRHEEDPTHTDSSSGPPATAS
jgi:hypothetical protein